MYPFIVCACGRSLGDLYPAYLALKRREYVKKCKDGNIDLNIDPAMLALMGTLNLDMSHVWKILGLHLPCCQGRMITQVEFKSVY